MEQNNKTRDGIEVKVGQVWQEIKRPVRFMVVTHVVGSTAFTSPHDGTNRRHAHMGLRNVGRLSRLSIDGLRKRWTLIKDV